jgi:hypothetical protein
LRHAHDFTLEIADVWPNFRKHSRGAVTTTFLSERVALTDDVAAMKRLSWLMSPTL